MTHDAVRRSSATGVVGLVAALLLATFGVYPLANTLTGGEAVQWYAHSLRFWIVVGGGMFVALLAAGRIFQRPLDSLWRVACRWVLAIPVPVLVTCVSLFAVTASATFAVVCFGRQPHNADEVAQLFHARILLSGRLSLPVDPNPGFFGMDNMIEQGRWYSQFPIGGPAFLAVGLALHAAWLVNPVLLGLTVVALFKFARLSFGDPVARVSILLLALSPFALFMSASFMNHVPVLWLATVALAELAEWVEAGDARRINRNAVLIGLALGAAFAIRPLDALVVAAATGTMQLIRSRDRARTRSLAIEIIAGLVPAALFFLVNARTNGAPLRLGYEVLYGSAHQLGFHVDPYGSMHTPARALTFASKYLLQLDIMLFGWPLPAVGVIIAGLLALKRPGKWDVFVVALVLAQVVAYALYWHDGAFRGPRFLFTALPAIVILTARAPFLLASRTQGAVRLAIVYAMPVCVAFAWFANGIGNSVPTQVRLYEQAPAAGRVDPDSLARTVGLHNALVFVNEGREARNLHDLWALGMSRGDAARISVSASPCAVRVAIASELLRQPQSQVGRLDRIVMSAHAVDAPESATFPPICSDELRRDDAGTASFAPFFPANRIDASGHVGGDVVYVLDLGPRNELLRARFGNRTWYRFGPHARSQPLPTPIPYANVP